MYPTINYCLLRILSIIMILLIIPSSYCHQYENCSQPFHCGGIKNISYPFWGGNRSVVCGYPGFELFNCRGEIPLIRIGSTTYGILDIDYDRQTFKAARQVLGDKTSRGLVLNTALNSELFRFPSRFSSNREDGSDTGKLVVTGDLPFAGQSYIPGRRWLAESGPVPSPSSIGNSLYHISLPPRVKDIENRRWLLVIGPVHSPAPHRLFVTPIGEPGHLTPTPSPSSIWGSPPPISLPPEGREGLSLGVKLAIGISTTVAFVIFTLSFIVIRKTRACDHIKILHKEQPTETGLKKSNPKAENIIIENETNTDTMRVRKHPTNPVENLGKEEIRQDIVRDQ